MLGRIDHQRRAGDLHLAEPAADNALQVTVVGKAEGNATLKGTFDNPGRGGAGTFVATRK